MTIHPTARISPQAIIGDDVEIGADCTVQAHAVIEGHTTLGPGNFVGYGAIIGAPPQDFAFQSDTRSATRIGAGNTFREYVTIHRGTKEGSETVVGDGCYLMVGSHLGHNVRLGNKVVIANNCLLAGYVEVGDGAVLGGGTVFHQFVRIGRLAMVAGGTRFSKDIPPCTLADGRNMLAGLNVVGLRRAGMSPAVRQELRRAFKLIFRGGKSVREALEESVAISWGPDARSFLDFLAATKRGICNVRRMSAADGPVSEEAGI